MATDKKLLLKIVNKLKDMLEMDMPHARTIQVREDDPNILFLTFMKRVKQKADKYKKLGGYRCLCSIPSFMLTLVLVARIRQHYIHCL
jgi:hypothetical protein